MFGPWSQNTQVRSFLALSQSAECDLMVSLYFYSMGQTIYRISDRFLKANKRLYALRLLARSKVPAVDLIAIYCALVRSILEYGSPVWAALAEYLIDAVEGV